MCVFCLWVCGVWCVACARWCEACALACLRCVCGVLVGMVCLCVVCCACVCRVCCCVLCLCVADTKNTSLTWNRRRQACMGFQHNAPTFHMKPKVEKLARFSLSLRTSTCFATLHMQCSFLQNVHQCCHGMLVCQSFFFLKKKIPPQKSAKAPLRKKLRAANLFMLASMLASLWAAIFAPQAMGRCHIVTTTHMAVYTFADTPTQNRSMIVGMQRRADDQEHLSTSWTLLGTQVSGLGVTVKLTNI